MARVGLVQFARVARSVAEAAIPRYAYARSKHTFTQPQLLAVLLVMRYDGWTFREAEVRLAEHTELRTALGLHQRVPDYTTLWRFLDRVEPAVLDRVLAEVDRRMGPPKGPGGGARALLLALDATGLATGEVSTFFVRREYEIKGQVRERASWLKWVVVADVERQLILAQTAHRAPTNDSRQLRVLCAAPAVRAHPIRGVLADKEFDAEANHRFVHEVLGATSVIPARAMGRGGPPRTPYRAQMTHAFPRALYHRRVLIETLFSTIKRTQGSVAPGRSESHQCKQALLLGASFNVARLRRAA